MLVRIARSCIRLLFMTRTRYRSCFLVVLILPYLLLYLTYDAWVHDNEVQFQETRLTLRNAKNYEIDKYPIFINKTRIKELRSEYEHLHRKCPHIGNDSELLEPVCRGVFYPTQEQNLRFIEEQYPMDHAQSYFTQHHMDVPVNDTLDESNFTPVFVTAASSGFYGRMQRVIKDIHGKIFPRYPNAKFIIYDLGLTDEQRNKTEASCRCEVRRFRFKDYPDYTTNLKIFAWKIFIIQEVAQEFGQLMWMDTSLQFRTGNMDAVFAHAHQHGISIWDNEFYFPPTSLTDPRMFGYFGEERCLFKDLGMVEANGLVIFLTNIMLRGFLRPLVACALDKNCIAPQGSSPGGCRLQALKLPTYRCCHRQDQSAMSIIIQRLYRYSQRRDIYQPPKLFDIVR